LFGLSSFSIEQRGIRKVLGAPVKTIVFTPVKKFVVLVLLGLILAIPVTYYGMEVWLEGFSYTDDISISPFIYGGLFSVIFAVITVSYETLRAAYANPVDTLRSE